MKTITDYYIEYQHPESDIWQRTFDYYKTIQDVKARIKQFETMDYMRDVTCRIVERTQTFVLLTRPRQSCIIY
jgi:hypothetical protein